MEDVELALNVEKTSYYYCPAVYVKREFHICSTIANSNYIYPNHVSITPSI